MRRRRRPAPRCCSAAAASATAPRRSAGPRASGGRRYCWEVGALRAGRRRERAGGAAVARMTSRADGGRNLEDGASSQLSRARGRRRGARAWLLDEGFVADAARGLRASSQTGRRAARRSARRAPRSGRPPREAAPRSAPAALPAQEHAAASAERRALILDADDSLDACAYRTLARLPPRPTKHEPLFRRHRSSLPLWDSIYVGEAQQRVLRGLCAYAWTRPSRERGARQEDEELGRGEAGSATARRGRTSRARDALASRVRPRCSGRTPRLAVVPIRPSSLTSPCPPH